MRAGSKTINLRYVEKGPESSVSCLKRCVLNFEEIESFQKSLTVFGIGKRQQSDGDWMFADESRDPMPRRQPSRDLRRPPRLI
jgi:hypothetical protein